MAREKKIKASEEIQAINAQMKELQKKRAVMYDNLYSQDAELKALIYHRVAMEQKIKEAKERLSAKAKEAKEKKAKEKAAKD